MAGKFNSYLVIFIFFLAKVLKNKFCWLIFLLSIFIAQNLLFTSCKKETDNQHPIITFVSPYELQGFNVLESIPITASISDDKIIKSLKIGVVDSNFSPVLPSIYIYPNSANYKLDIEFPIDDLYLESGEYYVFIKAEDGTNFKNQYQLIFISGIPREFEKLLVLTQGAFNEIQVSEIDKSENFNFMFNINGDYSGSASNSRYQQLYIAGKNTINLNTYDLIIGELAWLIEASPPIPMHNNDCLYFNEEIYVSFQTNYIYGYLHNGSQVFNTTVENDQTPSRLAKFNEFLLVDLQSKTGGMTYVATYYLATGAEKQRLVTNYKVVDFLKLDNNNVLIAGNDGGGGVLNTYDPYTNIETTQLSVPGKITCITKLTDNNFIIGTDNNIFVYDYDQSFLTSILPEKAVYRICFDESENNIYTVSPKLIEKIKYPQMLPQKTYPLPDSIFNIHLLYNK